MNITHSRHNWEAGHYGRLSALCDELRDLLSSNSSCVERIRELDEILYVLDPDELERIWLEKEYSKVNSNRRLAEAGGGTQEKQIN